MHLVPANKIADLFSSIENCLVLYSSAFFKMGMDSPLSIASFTTHVPFNRIISQGIVSFSGICMRSPGTKSSESIVYLYFAKSFIGVFIGFLGRQRKTFTFIEN